MIGEIVGSSGASSAAAGRTMSEEEEQEERRMAIMTDYREGDRRLRRDQPRVVRAIVRQVCLDGLMVRPFHLRQVRQGLSFLAALWRIEEEDG